MTGEPGSTPPPDDDTLRDALIQMMSIRGRGRFQVITYSGDDGGADEKMDYSSAAKAMRAARGYVLGKAGLTYEGALVYDKVERRVVRLFGSFPDGALSR